MEKKNQLQISLEEWAEKTVKAYHEIAQEVNLAYYTQSDLSKITESPEVAIVGINPGGGEKDTYEGQRNNKNWSYLHKNNQDKYTNEQAWLCASKTLFTKKIKRWTAGQV